MTASVGSCACPMARAKIPCSLAKTACAKRNPSFCALSDPRNVAPITNRCSGAATICISRSKRPARRGTRAILGNVWKKPAKTALYGATTETSKNASITATSSIRSAKPPSVAIPVHSNASFRPNAPMAQSDATITTSISASRAHFNRSKSAHKGRLAIVLLSTAPKLPNAPTVQKNASATATASALAGDGIINHASVRSFARRWASAQRHVPMAIRVAQRATEAMSSKHAKMALFPSLNRAIRHNNAIRRQMAPLASNLKPHARHKPIAASTTGSKNATHRRENTKR